MKDYSKYDFYNILGIERASSFQVIKKAYYQKAKNCHPDLHGGSKEKEEEFKLIVLAFDVLSDPDKKSLYDLSRSAVASEQNIHGFEPSESSVMDSDADDTLEELIVGNDVPENATLATLFLDLEKTEVFMTFREGKCLYKQKNYHSAVELFEKIIRIAPQNILYRYYLARSYASLKRFSLATRHYSEGIKIGGKRIPPQKLIKFHRELDFVRKKSNPFLQSLISFFTPKTDDHLFFDSEGEMIDEINRAIKNLSAEIEEKRKKKEKHMIE